MRFDSLVSIWVASSAVLIGSGCSDGTEGEPNSNGGSGTAAVAGSTSGGGFAGQSNLGGAGAGTSSTAGTGGVAGSVASGGGAGAQGLSGNAGTASGGNAGAAFGGSAGTGTAGSTSAGASGQSGSGGASCEERELFAEGSFDGDNSNWTQSSAIWPALIVTGEMAGLNVMPQAGSHFARLGGSAEVGNDLLLFSMVTVPESATNLVFSYYALVMTEDSSSDAHDTMFVVVDSDKVYARDDFDNTEVFAEWRRFETVLEPSAAGKTHALLIRAQNDGAPATTFLVDSVSLKATVCP